MKELSQLDHLNSHYWNETTVILKIRLYMFKLRVETLHISFLNAMNGLNLSYGWLIDYL